VTSRDPSGRLTGETFGNNVSTSRTYNNREFLTSIVSTEGKTTVQQLGYKYDPGGRLIHRDDSAAGASEDFIYDPLNRLTAWNVTQNGATVSTSYSYNDIGNLLSRTVTAEPSGTVLQSDGFTYGGSAAGEHALTQSLSAGTTYNYGYDSAGNQTAAPTRTVTYTVKGLPRTLTPLTTGSTQTGEVTHFTYDGNGERASKTAGSASTTYAGRLFERRENPLVTTDTFYVTYSGRPLAAYFGTTVGGRPSNATNYIHTERLGSTDAITGANGAMVGTLKYDPYGTHRNSGNIATPASLPIGDIRRGFTAHEHDDEFDLINMRGRIYDATIAHFLTPDPLVARPLVSESYNSYAYAFNSPLSFTDPSGLMAMAEKVTTTARIIT
jgi:RHS repeat-associated protein